MIVSFPRDDSSSSANLSVAMIVSSSPSKSAVTQYRMCAPIVRQLRYRPYTDRDYEGMIVTIFSHEIF